MRILRNLRIEEVSAVIKGSNPSAKVMLRKSDATSARARGDFWDEDPPYLFDDIMRKAVATDDDDNIDPNATASSLLPKLNDMVAAMVVADPTQSEEQHLFSLLHTAHGRKLAEHLNNLTKKEHTMPQVDIMKVIAVTEQCLMATIVKREGERYDTAFARKFESDIEFRKQWRDLTEAKHTMLVSKGMATLTPTSTEVGSSATSDDSAEAVRLLQEMAAKNGKSFEEVFAAPENRALAARTYTKHHLPEFQG
jgi:hypothetical protein